MKAGLVGCLAAVVLIRNRRFCVLHVACSGSEELRFVM